jgi:hypothetical protein
MPSLRLNARDRLCACLGMLEPVVPRPKVLKSVAVIPPCLGGLHG